MALPATIDATLPPAGGPISNGDDEIRNLKQLLVDVLGLPTSPTQITAAAFSIAAGGVVTFSQGNVVFPVGSVSAPSWAFSGDLDTGIYHSAADSLDIAVGGVQGFRVFLNSSVTQATLLSTEAGTTGPTLNLTHDSASPADNDVLGVINFNGDDSGGTPRIAGQIHLLFQDVTSTTMDSEMRFRVMDNVNAGDVNTTGSLSSLGVWTDASGREGKEFDGDVDNVLGKLRALPMGKYHGRNVPQDKLALAEHHYSATAEDFFTVFGLGRDPSKTDAPGIAPKDVAFLAIKAVMELEDRVKVLEALP